MCRERRNIKLVIAYNGAAYHGWQRQAPGLDTVQEQIERAAARIMGHPVNVHGAGRTDAGVHADGQVAARQLVGKHDFVGLAASAEVRENTVRTIFSCRVSQIDRQVHVTVQGDGFLYKMVRIITGTLVEIGRGRWSPQRIARILASCDRRDAGPTASPEGLTLVCVHYDPAELGQDRGSAT
jgi:tRNA U38,U39,U40 pseudouridine synthase TruA